MLRLISLDVATVPLQTRMPFRYGIAELTAVPHIYLRATIERSNGEKVQGVAAESLLPRWFEKDPNAPFQRDLDRLWAVIREAGKVALEIRDCTDTFALWRELYAHQLAWGAEQGYAPLLSHFGVTLVERCVLDAVCRVHGKPLWALLSEGTITLDCAGIQDAPSPAALAEVTRAVPLAEVHARHTIGLSDPLTRADLSNPINDGLPESLEEDIVRYGLTHFKIKVQGDPAIDTMRLETVGQIIHRTAGPGYRFTLDGNETFLDAASFRTFWEAVRSSPTLDQFFAGLVFVEQPFKREIALSESVAQELREWTDAPPIIIDESDGSLADLPSALRHGYRGTSHKNCKGVFKGLINAARIADHQRQSPQAGYLMSGEDLINIGPVALLQDLAMVAKLRISHVERNGHHYFRGLSQFPEAVQQNVLQHHPDLYESRSGYPELRIAAGKIALKSINSAAFGTAFVPSGDYVPLTEWSAPVAPQA